MLKLKRVYGPVSQGFAVEIRRGGQRAAIRSMSARAALYC